MPAYNEVRTVREAIDRVLSLDISDVDIRLIIVESNSTDGTREIVVEAGTDPRAVVVLEDRPSGKGLAVRKGLAIAQGDLVLIQDADLEYDVADYPALLAPLIDGRADFVIGSRYVPGAAMREFVDRPRLARLMNIAHRGFTGLFNIAFRTALEDPFTMYKVFRRECILGMTFRAQRFDFDWELVAKIVRRGYMPLEIPVNYRSRTYDEGKKVRFFRDPITWVWRCAVCRVERPEHPTAADWALAGREHLAATDAV